MCGIVFTQKLETTQQALHVLRHRGPDESAVVSCGQLGYLGHARLSIVDINEPRAKQPMGLESGSKLAFNGELFNYKDLGDDSEVETLYRCLTKKVVLADVLNGYYAAIHYDAPRGQVSAHRDVFGVMPLYYTKSPFAVASEKKALSYLGVAIKRVPPGGSVVYDGTKVTERRRRLHGLTHSITKASVSILTDAFNRAVWRTASHSDCGFDLALSGGLDSSLILASLVQQGLMPERIVSTYLEADNLELSRAKRLVEFYGLSDRHVLVAADEVPDLRHWIETPPNPIRDFAFRRHWHVAKSASSKVILCGEGADELGLGYPLNRNVDDVLDRVKTKTRLLASQDVMTLDRVNKAGMAWSKEYRVPFLDREFVSVALSMDQREKSLFREMARALELPTFIVDAPKYSTEETKGRQL